MQFMVDGAFSGHILLMIDSNSTRREESNDISHAMFYPYITSKKNNFLKIQKTSYIKHHALGSPSGALKKFLCFFNIMSMGIH
jgi:hypothetical protein